MMMMMMIGIAIASIFSALLLREDWTLFINTINSATTNHGIAIARV